MTDNEIIKALECCVKNDVAQCTICPYYDMLHGCRRAMEKEVLDLINHQKAEIERLKQENKKYKTLLEARINPPPF